MPIRLTGIVAIVAACELLLSAGRALADDTPVRLSVMTLNLHGYQESRAEGIADEELTEKQIAEQVERHDVYFERIATAIRELQPDIVCLQEVAESPADGRDRSEAATFGASDSNMVRRILSRLDGPPYVYTMDWSHYAWDTWLEGSAILSQYPIAAAESRYVSRPENRRPDVWKTRKVPMAAVDVPGSGRVNVYSVHLGWWDDEQEPFREQFDRLQAWIDAAPQGNTVLCGDFNVAAGSEGYRYLTSAGYVDAYAKASPGGFTDATVNAKADGWAEKDIGQRIDYVLTGPGFPLEAIHARRLFTSADYGRVSDHLGVYVVFGAPGRESASVEADSRP